MYNPAINQYLYKRFLDDVYGNVTGQTPNITSKCFVNKSDPDYILQESAQQRTSSFQVYLTSVSSTAAVISCMFLGASSDSVGRRFLFVVSLAGEGLRNAVNTAVIYWNLDFKYMFIGEVCEGVSGGYNGIMLASFAYTADNTPPKNSRTVGLAVVDFTTYFALAISQTGTGYFINYFGFMYPVLTSTGLIVLSIILIITIIPETVQRSGKRYPSPCAAVKNVFGFYFSKEYGLKRYLFWLALAAYFIAYLSLAGVYLLEYLFLMNLPFCWGPELIGYFNMAVAIARQVFGIPVIKLLHLCATDKGIAVFTAIVQAGAFVLHGIAYTDVMLFSYMIPAGVAVSLLPALRALMSRMSPADLQGSLFAGIVIMNVVSSGVGVASFNEIYDATVEMIRGFAFYTSAGLQIIVAILAGIYVCTSNRLSLKTRSATVVINDREWKPVLARETAKERDDSQV